MNQLAEIDQNIKKNIKIHVKTFFKVVAICLILIFSNYLISSLIIGNFKMSWFALRPMLIPVLLLLAIYFWHVKGYWEILHVAPNSSFQEIVVSAYPEKEVAEILPTIFRMKKYEEKEERLSFYIYPPRSISWSEYMSVFLISYERDNYQYKIISKSPGRWRFLNLHLGGGRNYRNVQKVKTLISLD